MTVMTVTAMKEILFGLWLMARQGLIRVGFHGPVAMGHANRHVYYGQGLWSASFRECDGVIIPQNQPLSFQFPQTVRSEATHLKQWVLIKYVFSRDGGRNSPPLCPMSFLFLFSFLLSFLLILIRNPPGPRGVLDLRVHGVCIYGVPVRWEENNNQLIYDIGQVKPRELKYVSLSSHSL